MQTLEKPDNIFRFIAARKNRRISATRISKATKVAAAIASTAGTATAGVEFGAGGILFSIGIIAGFCTLYMALSSAIFKGWRFPGILWLTITLVLCFSFILSGFYYCSMGHAGASRAWVELARTAGAALLFCLLIIVKRRNATRFK